MRAEKPCRVANVVHLFVMGAQDESETVYNIMRTIDAEASRIDVEGGRERIGAVVDRWYHLGLIRFDSHDDGSDDLILRWRWLWQSRGKGWPVNDSDALVGIGLAVEEEQGIGWSLSKQRAQEVGEALASEEEKK